jgi:Fe-S-cluster containining protein
MEKMEEINNENLSICSKCGGECCRTKPGVEAPERFLVDGNLEETLYTALRSGLWVLDSHYGLPATNGKPAIPASELELFYPRPATRGEVEEKGSRADNTADCVFLDPRGCRLLFEERPRMCRALEPSVGFDCSSEWTRLEAAIAWYPWQKSVTLVRRRIADSD